MALRLSTAYPSSSRGGPSTNLQFAAPADYAKARVRGLKALKFEHGLFELTRREGVLTSAWIEAPRAFDRLILSVSADLPDGCEAAWEAAVDATWHPLGAFAPKGGARGAEGPAVSDETLVLEKKHRRLRFRVTLRRAGKPRGKAVLRGVQVALTDSEAAVPAPGKPAPQGLISWRRDLYLEPVSQMEQDPVYAKRICSPTSVSMVLNYWGKRTGVPGAAAAVKDARTGIYGNWSLNTAYAASRGLSAHVARLNSIEELRYWVARGRPVVCSIAWHRGRLKGAALPTSAGHLVVVSGFDGEGGIWVHDPAAKTAGEVRRRYREKDFQHVWMERRRGLVYLIQPPLPRRMASLAAAAPVRTKSGKAAPWHKTSMLTEILYGETVEAVRAEGDRLEILAVGQPVVGPDYEAGGYRGWTDARMFTGADFLPDPNVVVKTRRGRFPCGTELYSPTRRARGGKVEVVLADGTLGALPRADLHLAPAATAREMRARVLETAALFLRDPYRWGGLSRGIDCSGLVYVAFRVAGWGIPRDSADQARVAFQIERGDLRAGDLVFFTAPGGERVNHVLLYDGKGGVIEANGDALRVERNRLDARLAEAAARRRAVTYGAVLPR